MGNVFGGGSKVKMPKQTAQNPQQTAVAQDQLTDAARKNRRLAASMITKDWKQPVLEQKKLLGG